MPPARPPRPWICLALAALAALAALRWMLRAEPEPRLFTVVTDCARPVGRLHASAREHGFRGVDVLMADEGARIGHRAGGQPAGFGQKLLKAYEYAGRQPPGRLLVFLDGFDVLVGAPPAEVARAFRRVARGRDVVVCSAEVFCWPDPGRAARFPPAPTPYRFLCSGAYAGSAGAIRRALAPHMTAVDNGSDDQRVFTDAFLDGRGAVVLDHRCELFQNLNKGMKYDLVRAPNGRWRNRVTASQPAIFHGNGGPASKAFLFDTIGGGGSGNSK